MTGLKLYIYIIDKSIIKGDNMFKILLEEIKKYFYYKNINEKHINNKSDKENNVKTDRLKDE